MCAVLGVAHVTYWISSLLDFLSTCLLYYSPQGARQAAAVGRRARRAQSRARAQRRTARRERPAHHAHRRGAPGHWTHKLIHKLLLIALATDLLATYSPLTTNLLTTCHLPLATHYSLFTTHYLPLTTNSPLTRCLAASRSTCHPQYLRTSRTTRTLSRCRLPAEVAAAAGGRGGGVKDAAGLGWEMPPQLLLRLYRRHFSKDPPLSPRALVSYRNP